MKKLEELMTIFVKNNLVVAAQMEVEAISYPVPGKINNLIVERFFLFSNQPKTVKSRPYAWLCVSSETGRLLQYCSCEVRDFAEELKVPLTQLIDYGAPMKGNNKELIAAKREFASLYAQLREFVFALSINEVQKEILFHYKALYDQLISTEVHNYYLVLSPEFYLWMTEILVNDRNTCQ